MENNGQQRQEQMQSSLDLCRDEGLRARTSFKKLGPSAWPERPSAASVSSRRTEQSALHGGPLHQQAEALREARADAGRGGGLRGRTERSLKGQGLQGNPDKCQSIRKGPKRADGESLIDRR